MVRLHPIKEVECEAEWQNYEKREPQAGEDDDERQQVFSCLSKEDKPLTDTSKASLCVVIRT